ncbi:hypothetical protein [Micromonospora ureilytica]|uniref:hypothetical protein n=1 Tax=Micromonospora ureilytica TaxID=709868 RepID=UPI002E124EB3|nr:hypothetical protein OHB55_05100 [Micromonospora ureilytica]
MNRRHVAVAASMIVVGVVGLVIGAVAVASGNLPMVGLVALGALVAVLGAALLRDAIRAARLSGPDSRRRRRSDTDGVAGYPFYPMPAGDAGSGHVGRQRDGDHDNSDGTDPVGRDSGGGDSGGGDSGGGDSGGGGGSS